MNIITDKPIRQVNAFNMRSDWLLSFTKKTNALPSDTKMKRNKSPIITLINKVMTHTIPEQEVSALYVRSNWNTAQNVS